MHTNVYLPCMYAMYVCNNVYLRVLCAYSRQKCEYTIMLLVLTIWWMYVYIIKCGYSCTDLRLSVLYLYCQTKCYELNSKIYISK